MFFIISKHNRFFQRASNRGIEINCLYDFCTSRGKIKKRIINENKNYFVLSY